VLRRDQEIGESRIKLRTNCAAPDCGKEFEFERGEARVFEVPYLFSKDAISTGQNCADVPGVAPALMRV